MQEYSFAHAKKAGSAHTRAALHTARSVLEREGSWLVLTLPLLLFLLCGMACYLFTAILYYVLEELTVLSYGWIDVLYYASVLLCCVCLLCPLLLGRLRMAGLLCVGERPLAKECFYYFTSARRYLRGLWLGSVYALSLLLPVALLSLAAVLPVLFFEAVLLPQLITGVAVLLLVLSYPVALLLAALVLLLVGRALCAVPLAVGNEQLGLLCAIKHSVCITKGKKREALALLWQSTWRLLFSAVTLFVLWVIYYAGILDVAYFQLSRALCRDAEAG